MRYVPAVRTNISDATIDQAARCEGAVEAEPMHERNERVSTRPDGNNCDR
jgi:hypothetical protein